MASEKHAARKPVPKKSGDNTTKATSAITLDTLIKKTFAAIVALVGVLAGIAVFTGPFARTGSGLLLMSLAALAALVLAGVGLAVLYTYRKNKITMSVGVTVAVAALIIAVGAGVGYLTWHARSPAAASAGPSATGPTNSRSAPPASAIGYTAQVAWTNDGGGGGSFSTTLYAFTSPRSHIHEGAYPLGESITVVCQIPDGRAVQVGPTYKGPDPDSTVWYRLDNSAWVPGVYVHVDRPSAVPPCR